MPTIEQLRGDIRYAIRLCERTARLYRRIQAVGTFLSLVGGSAAVSGAAGQLPAWVALSGSALLAVSGAALVAIRPADKAAQNEADVKRYRALMAKSFGMSVEQLAVALEEAHQGDAPEVEPLRAVAYNDMLAEINREDQKIPLSLTERLLRAIA